MHFSQFLAFLCLHLLRVFRNKVFTVYIRWHFLYRERKEQSLTVRILYGGGIFCHNSSNCVRQTQSPHEQHPDLQVHVRLARLVSCCCGLSYAVTRTVIAPGAALKVHPLSQIGLLLGTNRACSGEKHARRTTAGSRRTAPED